MTRPRLLGTALALLSAAAFGVMPVLTEVVHDDGVGTLGVLSVRFTLAALVLLALARWRGEPLPGGRPLLGLGSAAAYALYIIVSSGAAPGTGPVATAAVVMGSCAVVYDVAAVAAWADLPGRASAWLSLVRVAPIGTVVAVAAFFVALALLGPSDTAVVSTAEPVVTVVTAAAFLGERLGPVQIAGGALVLLAVLVLTRSSPVPEPVVAA